MSGKHKKKQQPQPKKEGKFITVVLVGMAMLIVGAISTWLLISPRDSAFEKAVKNPALREVYIAQLVEKTEKPEGLTEVVYVNTPAEYDLVGSVYEGLDPDKIGLMVTEVTTSPGGFTARIFIFENVFSAEKSNIKQEADLLSSLKHEYRHIEIEVDEDRLGPVSRLEIANRLQGKENSIAMSLLEAIKELIATDSEFQNPGVSKEYAGMIVDNYMRYYAGLWDLENKLDLVFLKSLKIEFFRDWMRIYFREANQKTYLRHPVTGETYLLPDEITQ